MKTFKYVTALLVFAAMSATFVSCDKEVNPDVDAKQNYWMDVTLSDAGSLSAAAQARFAELVDSVVWGSKGAVHTPMYCTSDYAQTNFNKVAALSNEENDIVQKIMIPTAKFETPNVYNFAVTLTLSKDEMNTTIATKTWNASELQ